MWSNFLRSSASSHSIPLKEIVSSRVKRLQLYCTCITGSFKDPRSYSRSLGRARRPSRSRIRYTSGSTWCICTIGFRQDDELAPAPAVVDALDSAGDKVNVGDEGDASNEGDAQEAL